MSSCGLEDMGAFRNPAKLYLLVSLLLSFASTGDAQIVNREKVAEQLQKDGCATLAGDTIKVCKYDYRSEGKQIEAITTRPIAEGRYPGVVLLPARSTALTHLTMATILAKHGFASLSISDIGFGGSEGKPDFMGPATIRAFAAGFRKFEREPFVDSKKIGLFGYSRGGMAASLLTIRLGKDVKAAVFGSGVYDFRRAYDETKIEGIRENMKAETGMTEVAIRERSSILEMEKLKSPVLILHGENDANAPTNQALLLRDRLNELKKNFEIRILRDHKHGQIKTEFILLVVDFLSRKLKGESVVSLKMR